MFTPEHQDYLNEVVETVNRLADEDPSVRVADLINVAFGLVDPADYVNDPELDLVSESDEERAYVKERIR